MNDIHVTPTRARRRKQSDRAAAVAASAYITRNLAPFDALDEESLQCIEATADRNVSVSEALSDFVARKKDSMADKWY